MLVVVAVLLVVGGLALATGGWGAPRPGAVAAERTPEPTQAASAPAAAASAAPAAPQPPTALELPSLGVRAAVSPIATEAGALNPPDDPRQVGWWSGGAVPGADRGAAVVTGHTVHTGGGAFDDLEQLAVGDPVAVSSPGRAVDYVVRSVRVLSRDELAARSQALFARDGGPRLVLVTCEDWDGTAYRSNVVVVARPA